MAASSQPDPAPGSRPPSGDGPLVLGDFQILERIGQGAMGTVFKARQRSMDRLVAVKVLRPVLAGDSAYVERFFREARAAARLNHPNIVLALNVGEDHGYYYFAMEYLEGHTVGLLLKAGPFEERRALDIALQMSRALDHAWTHERIVHRDIKPGNILIAQDGTAKLADLGLAHEAMREDADAPEVEDKILGTPHYIAPEQILRGDLDVRCDLYALGATLFHMLTGRPPFDAPTTKAILSKHIREPVPDPRQLRPDLTESTAYIVMRLLAKDREDRYPDARALEDDIEAVLRGEPVGPRRAVPHVRRVAARRPQASSASYIGLAIVLLILVGAVAIGAWRLVQESRGRPDGENSKPPPTKDLPALDPRLAVARRVFEEAEAYIEAHPADLAGAVERLRDVERRFRDTPVADEAALRRIPLDAELEKRNTEALKALLRRAEALVAETRYADALALFQKPPANLLAESWRDRLAAAHAGIESRARHAFQAALARGDAAAGRGEFDAALRAYEAAGASLPDAWRQEAADRVAGVHRRQKEAADETRAAKDAAHARLMADLAELYRTRKYDAALQLLKERLATAPADERDLWSAELAEAEKLLEFWAHVQRGASRLIGQDFVVRGIQGKLVSAEEGRVTIRTRGGSFTEEIRSLTTDQILALATPAYTSVDAPAAAVRFLAAEGRGDAAEARLKAIEVPGPDAAALRAHVGRLAMTARLAAAKKELEEARKLVTVGDQGAAAALRLLLQHYGGQPAAAALCAEARRLLKQVAAPEPPDENRVRNEEAPDP